MMRFCTCALFVVAVMVAPGGKACAQTSYDDVAVIVNANSPASQTIGNYFKARRDIPAKNIITVSCSTAEEIDAAEFNSFRTQVESYMQANDLVNAINYIVTTKGVPLKINRGDTSSTNSPSASVESELMCILGSYANSIGGKGRAYSPYYSKATHFSHAEQGIYLVTRLDAYSTKEVLDLIDRSGPSTQMSTSSKYVFDQDPAWNASAAYLNDYMSSAQTILAAKGKPVELNSDSVYVTSRETVAGYVSWGSNDHHADEFTTHALPLNSWAPGAIVETYVSTSGRSFDDPPSYGQSLIADLIEEGVSGAKAYVYEPYSTSMAIASILFDRYTSGYNLAESYFMASRYVSWMDVVVGDPKTSIQEVQGPLPVQMNFLHADAQTTTGAVLLRWGTLTEMNNYGFTVQRADTVVRRFEDLAGSFVRGHGTTLEPQAYAWSDNTVSPGTYYYRLKQVDLDGTLHYSEQHLVRVAGGLSSVHSGTLPASFTLEQNYPNPFNPSTRIRYSVPSAGNVRLAVYNAIGQEVGLLVQEYQAAGDHEITFAPDRLSSLASGTYFYRLQTGERVATKSMVYLK
jgi:uncharacterized protein (TIGR03790 family)